VLTVENLQKTFKVSRAFKKPLEVHALRGVSLEVKPGETLAIVGESGCGKSTLAKVLMKIESATGGRAEMQGQDLLQMPSKELSAHVQMIFQDPYSSINPRKKIFDIIAEPLKIKGQSASEIQSAVEAVARQVGLRPEMLSRYPHMLSGGQRQRVGIARALVTRPQLIICDEPVSALDVSVQAQVLNLLLDLQQEKKLSYLFISHDLGVVRFLAHRVGVMYLGRIVEMASRDQIFSKPVHPYTRLLLKSTPSLRQKTTEVELENMDLPSPVNPPSGCGFHTRCPYMTDLCKQKTPELRNVEGRQVACHLAEKIQAEVL
jgi:dipeptide transport system ATP-binding protein